MSGEQLERYDAIVVGGGVAGLVAARDVAAAGRSVRLLEASDRFGGRAWSGPFGGRGPLVEYGGGWFDAGLQAPLRAEIDRYEIAYGPATQYATTRWHTGGVLRHGFPVPVGEGADLERAIVALNAAGRAFGADPQAWFAREDRSVAELVEELGVGAATRDFLHGWIGLMTGVRPEDTSASGVLGLIAETGNVYAFYSDLAHVFAEGTNSLTGALVADLGCPADVRRAVTAIEDGEDGVVVTTADGARLACEVCVLAVPLNVMGSIRLTPELPPACRVALAEGHPNMVDKLWIAATGVPERMLAAGWNTPFHWLAAEKPLDAARDDDAQLIVAFALKGAIDADDPEAVQRALRAYAPEARVLEVDRHDWARDPWSRGAWASARVGWGADGTLEALTAPHGRVLPAGSDVAAEFSGWIAGAVASGTAAAREAIARLAAAVA